MRNMSFAMTTNQIQQGTKFVTRRFGWWSLKSGDVVMAVERAMGLRKGEKVRKLRPIRVVDTTREPLNAITQEDCILEGFPDYSPAQFVDMLCKHYGCAPDKTVNRIQFEYIEPA